MSAPVIANALEQQRQYHEEVERTLQAAAEARNVSLPAQRQRVNADHLVRDMMEVNFGLLVGRVMEKKGMGRGWEKERERARLC
jgi:hypothetical protein